MALSFESTNELITIRDWLRYAVSGFNAARLTYGHGTVDAVDEAAFLILETLNLPIDKLEPFLDGRLLMSEREALRAVIDERITSRMPASYLTRSAYIQGHRFYVDERTIVPRSFIGELLTTGRIAELIGPSEVRTILDLCTGSGCLAILAALGFPRATVDATDVSGDALAVAAVNVAEYRLQERVRLAAGDLFAAVPGRRYDLIIANPPYVAEAVVAAFPPEHRAEPRLAHIGGRDGLDLVRRILASADQHLEPGGHLIVEIGTGRDIIEAEYPDLPLLWLDTELSEGEVFALAAPSVPSRQVPAAKSRKTRKAGI